MFELMSGATQSTSRFELNVFVGDGATTIQLQGALSIDDSEEFWHRVSQYQLRRNGSLQVDLEGLDSCDGSGAALLLELRGRAREQGGEVAFLHANEQVARILALYGCPTEASPRRGEGRRSGLFDQVGVASIEVVRIAKQALEFLGAFVVATRDAIRRPASVNWIDIAHLSERAGADGVPIILMINFLIGAIMALQSAEQLQRFGAGIFVADLVGLSVVRELGPLMTAIIVAGRSGAAFAAELGTMRVSEEVDALETLGLDPQRYLVFPRIIALVLVMPLLVLMADFVGCLGGLFVAITAFDLTTVAYVKQLGGALDLGDLLGGLLKGTVFAGVITLVACQKGLSTRGGAEGVGLSTTSAVVSILFSLVALDALFTVIFNLFGI